jgi:hypothetical protein
MKFEVSPFSLRLVRRNTFAFKAKCTGEGQDEGEISLNKNTSN